MKQYPIAILQLASQYKKGLTMRVLALSAALCFFSLPLMAAELSARSAAIEREGQMARELGMRSLVNASRITHFPDVLQCLKEIQGARFLAADYSDERNKYFRVYKEGSLTPDYYMSVSEYGFNQDIGTRSLLYIPRDEARNRGPVLTKMLECIPVE